MDGVYALDGFQFDDDATLQQQVQLKVATDSLAFVLEGDTSLLFDLKAIPAEFDDHAIPIHGLQQSRPYGSVHFNGAANDFLCQRFYIYNVGGHARCLSTKRAGFISSPFSRMAGPG